MPVFCVIVPLYVAATVNVPALHVPRSSMVQSAVDVESNVMVSVVAGTVPPFQFAPVDHRLPDVWDHVFAAMAIPP